MGQVQRAMQRDVISVSVVRMFPACEDGGRNPQAGVGCFVLNEHQQVLMVQERSGPLRGKGELPA